MRGTVLLLYAFHLLVAADGNAIVPLLPEYTTRFDLSVFDAGVLVGIPAAAMLVLSLPVGMVSDRLGARPMTIAASALLTVAALGQALATTYVVLLGSWMLFGITSAIIYTAAPAWLDAVAPQRDRIAVLGGVATFAGIGLMVGPAFAGLLSGYLGPGSPFLVIAAVSAFVTAGLALRPATQAMALPPVPGGSLRALFREPHMASVLALMCFVGALGGVVSLLVPLRLDELGVGAGSIGIAFTVTTGLFVLTSIQIQRLGNRVPMLGASGAAALALGAVLLLPVFAASALLLIVFLVLRAPLWSVISTISNPLCAYGAQRACLGTGFGLAVMNLCWAAGNLGGPVAGGALADLAGDGAVYIVLALMGSAIGVGVLRIRTPSAASRAQLPGPTDIGGTP